MLGVVGSEERNKIREILEPYAESFFNEDEDEPSVEVYIDGYVSFDKMAKIVDYIRNKEK